VPFELGKFSTFMSIIVIRVNSRHYSFRPYRVLFDLSGNSVKLGREVPKIIIE
jgi:hypothetical protein